MEKPARLRISFGLLMVKISIPLTSIRFNLPAVSFSSTFSSHSSFCFWGS